jgi:hypothetical protein
VTEPIQVPTIGEPELPAEIVTERALEEIIQGSRVIHARHQGFTKAMARKLLAAEAERDAATNKSSEIVRQWSRCLDDYNACINERNVLRAELVTARQTIERLSAPVSDAENKYLFDLHDVLSEQDREPAPDIRKAVNALIAARKDAKSNDKEQP